MTELGNGNVRLLKSLKAAGPLSDLRGSVGHCGAP